MSCQIVLNTWSGRDQGRASVKMAKVFRLEEDQRLPVMNMLAEGIPWYFDYQISEKQAQTAASYLRSLGFEVDLKPLGVEQADEVPPEEIAQPEAGTRGSPAMKMEFNGTGGEMFGIYLVNFLKTVFTLGIYHFWAKTRVRHYLWSRTLFASDHFSYHGTGAELFKGFLKFFGIVLVFGVVIGLLQFYAGLDQKLASNLMAIPMLIFFPALMVGAWRYRLSRTAWRGIRFSFRGKRMTAVGIYLKGYIFTALTLGIYWPYFKIQTEKFWRENSYFGNKKFGFTGQGKDIFGRFLGGILLTVLTVGLYWFWFQAFLQRYLWSQTRIEGGKFKFTATGAQMLGLWFVNLLILIFTLGLGFPWVVVRTRRFIANHLSLEGFVLLNKVVQEMKESGALGEEALDAFDVPLDIG